MAYEKPGVDIYQVQQSFSPTLIAPDLPAVDIGPAYVVYPSDGVNSFNYGTYTASGSTVITLSGLTPYSYLDGSSTYVDLYVTSGVNAGNRIHLENSVVSPGGFTSVDGGTTVTIASGLASSAWNGAQIFIGYRALNYAPDLVSSFLTFESLTDIDTVFGVDQVVPDNPLPFAISQSMGNTVTSVNAVVVCVDDWSSLLASGTLDSEHTRAIDLIAAQEVYGIAPLTANTAQIAKYTVHCDAMSQPIMKHERICFSNPAITWYNASSAVVTDPRAADKATTARFIRDSASAILDTRTFYTHPDLLFYEVTWPVQKLNPAYLANIFGSAIDPATYAVLASPYRLASGVTYNPGTQITPTVYAALKADTLFYKFDAFIPTPGAYLAADVVGQVSGQNPEQGFTNLPIAGPSKLRYSNDWFSEVQLNTIASGGVYIMVNTGGTISSRHQLSTNMTTIENRELNITKTVDYVSKFIRNTVSGFIGRSLITPGFLLVLGNILAGLGTTLVKQGRLNAFKVTSVTQSTVSPDTVLVTLQITPKYPVNYITVNLIF